MERQGKRSSLQSIPYDPYMPSEVTEIVHELAGWDLTKVPEVRAANYIDSLQYLLLRRRQQIEKNKKK